jgi:hypothetical protein
LSVAVSNQPIFPQSIRNAVQTIAPADTTTVKTLAAGGTNGSKVETILVTSTDTAAQTLQLWATISSTNYLLGSVPIPLGSGNTGTVITVDVLRSAQLPGLPYDSNGNKYLYLASGTTLSVSTLATVTTAKLLAITAFLGDF